MADGTIDINDVFADRVVKADVIRVKDAKDKFFDKRLRKQQLGISEPDNMSSPSVGTQLVIRSDTNRFDPSTDDGKGRYVFFHNAEYVDSLISTINNSITTLISGKQDKSNTDFQVGGADGEWHQIIGEPDGPISVISATDETNAAWISINQDKLGDNWDIRSFDPCPDTKAGLPYIGGS